MYPLNDILVLELHRARIQEALRIARRPALPARRRSRRERPIRARVLGVRAQEVS